MEQIIAQVNPFVKNNKSALINYSIIILILAAGLVGGIMFLGKIRILAAMVMMPLFAMVVLKPRWAMIIFMFVLFINISLPFNTTVKYLDLAVIVLIASALTDFLLKPKATYEKTPLIPFLLFVLMTSTIAAVFSASPMNAVSHLFRVVIMTICFWSIFRLSRYFKLIQIVNIFFFFSVIHTIFALSTIVKYGFGARLFGLATSTLDDFLMITIPIGIVLFLFETGRLRKYYGLGILINTAGIILTQSRLPIMFMLMLSAAALYFSYKKISSSKPEASQKRVLKKIKLFLVSLTVSLLLVLLVYPNIFEAIFIRFQSLFYLTPGDTMYIRFALWGAALQAFLDNPLVGIGPGQFKYIGDLYNDLRFSYVFFFAKGMSAHNLLFHMLAETGILGGISLMTLMIRQFVISRKVYCSTIDPDKFKLNLIVYLVAGILLVSTVIEAGWFWGQTSYIFIFLLALIARNYYLNNSQNEVEDN